MNALMNALGYQFNNEELLKLALTHPSTRVNNLTGEDNQRLEFLGDAVLQLIVSKHLYDTYPNYDEGQLTALRTKIVCRASLVSLAKSLRLGEYLHITHGMEKMGGRSNPHNLEDALEAVIAAVYLDGGLDTALQVIRRITNSLPNFAQTPSINSKGDLQEYLQAQKLDLPEYVMIDKSGPAHEMEFTVALYVQGRQICQAKDKSIKAAEQKAAQMALQILRHEGV